MTDNTLRRRKLLVQSALRREIIDYCAVETPAQTDRKDLQQKPLVTGNAETWLEYLETKA
ncbi:MAG TPA: hypothetical protein VJ476_04295 [Rhizomicrobium sp.]|nr:hypothetical protein [Rhizomicrobium sp.]